MHVQLPTAIELLENGGCAVNESMSAAWDCHKRSVLLDPAGIRGPLKTRICDIGFSEFDQLFARRICKGTALSCNMSANSKVCMPQPASAVEMAEH